MLWLGIIVAFVAAVMATRASSLSGKSPISTLAGNGRQGYSGDGHRATSASLDLPYAVAVDKVGNVYIADAGNRVVRKVSASGIITTLAGTGELGFDGDGGPAIKAKLENPNGVAVDRGGNVYISDGWRVRRVDHGGTITTFAGTGISGAVAAPTNFSGDGGPATAAVLSAGRLTVDYSGNVYIADGWNHRVRKVDNRGTITTIAGGGERGHRGDGRPATAAELDFPQDVAVDRHGNVYIADTGDNRVRKVDRRGIITTFAGSERVGKSLGDGGPATKAQLYHPSGVAVDLRGNVYVADSGTYRVRKVATDGTITTLAGPGDAHSLGDGGPAKSAYLYGLNDVAVDSHGNVYATQGGINRVRKITNALPIASFTAAPASGTAPLTVRLDASASRDPDGFIVAYRWDFGDGTTDTRKKATHTYKRAGIFTVELIVIDDSGGVSKKVTRKIAVTKP